MLITKHKKKRQEAQQTTDIDKFNKAELQALNLSNAAKQMEDLIADNNAKLQKYNYEMQNYQNEVTTQVQQHQQNLSRYQLELSTVFQAWSKKESDNLNKYQSDIQNQIQVFNDANTEYQAELQKLLKMQD